MCQKLQHISNRKYEALTSFMRDQNTNPESLFVDSLDSHTFAELLKQERSVGKGSISRGGAGFNGNQDIIMSDIGLEDLLDAHNMIDLDNSYQLLVTEDVRNFQKLRK